MSAPQELRATVDRGFELHHAGAIEDALALYAELLADPPAAGDPVTVESLFAAAFDRAVILAEQGELEEAAAGFAEAARHPDPEDRDQRHEVAMARLNQGIALAMLGRTSEAADVYAGVVDAFVSADDVPTREQVARAWVNLAAAHLELEDPAAAAATAEELLGHLADADDVWVEEQRTHARELLAVAREAAGQHVHQ